MKKISLFIVILVDLAGLKGQLLRPGQHEQVYQWEYRFAGEKDWKSGTWQTDLIEEKAYEPYDSLKDLLRFSYVDSLRKLEDKDWEMRSVYKFSKNQVREKHTELYFEKLEPFAKIYINDQFIYENKNFFISRYLNVDSHITSADSFEIKIVFPALIKSAKQKYANEKIIYPSDNDETKVSQYIRKPAYQFGWDVAPRLLASGMFANIYVTHWTSYHITQAALKTDSLSEKNAFLSASFEIESDTAMEVTFNLPWYLKNDSLIFLKKGKQWFHCHFSIKDPELWWPNGIYQQKGQKKPKIYSFGFSFDIDTNGLFKYENVELKTGIRKIELVRNPDAFGESFYFKVNGSPVFLKGTNFLPDIWPYTNFGYDITNHTRLPSYHALRQLENSDYNMIRIWGGGDYPNEDALDYFDERGILLWQDFMFAGTMYPGDEEFLGNVKEEAQSQVKRISQHPCLALWCGNNEIEVAWKNWGWQKTYNYSVADSLQLIRNYKKIFNEILPVVIKENDANTAYIPSTPISNWGKKEEFTVGDNHYWGVWHGELPFETYADRVPRFMSEYGFPSLPCMNTINLYFGMKTSSLTDPALKFRMKSYKGIGLIEKYMKENYGEAKDLESFALLSQLQQAEAYKLAIEAQRRAKPFCMGTLYWQFNDAWPCISWSTVDYDRNLKAAFFAVNEAYKPIILSAGREREKINVFAISDLLKDTTVKIQITLIDFYGKIIYDTLFTQILKSNSSAPVFTMNALKLLSGNDERKVVLKMQLLNPQKSYRNLYYFVKTKDLILPQPKLKKKLKRYELILQSDVLVKDIYVDHGNDHSPDYDVEFFDLLPGEKKSVSWTERELAKIKILHFQNYIKPSK
jgi:beta-mannosidase